MASHVSGRPHIRTYGLDMRVAGYLGRLDGILGVRLGDIRLGAERKIDRSCVACWAREQM